MSWIVRNLWLIPALPVVAAGVSAVLPRRFRRASSGLAIGSMLFAFLLSLCAFANAAGRHGDEVRQFVNFPWFEFAGGAEGVLQLGWVLDPLSAVMLVMVTFVGLLIFIYSTGYMAHDANFTRFFTFLALFAGAMLGVVISNSLLLLFICWELVGLTSYLLIGFWYHKPSAAAAAKKAFITTRVGDVAFLIGMVWLYSETGTLLFYDEGRGCMESSALAALVTQTTTVGIAASTAIGLLIFAGAVGKSGQVPLHVWLPDAMEGPTPVSALIHAATMVAAGVFLVARVFPLMSAIEGVSGIVSANHAAALQVVTWIGAITAVFAATIAVAQTDIKRILAYSTVSQLGYMMMGLGVGGVAVGMFHLITHAFFKALLFLGAGSVIHGCNEEQDIRRMGGLRTFMPVTFATYAVGMLALAGFPIFFSGFWSKDEILHAAHQWPVSHIPFYLGLFGALLTAFYMTRQVALVFFGSNRRVVDSREAKPHSEGKRPEAAHAAAHGKAGDPHESPRSMTMPLVALAVCAVGLSIIGTPAWPWFHGFLTGHSVGFNFSRFSEGGIVSLMAVSSVIVLSGIGLGWWLYGRTAPSNATEPDPLERMRPDIFHLLRNKYWIDEVYEKTVIAFNAWWARACDFLDAWVWAGLVQVMAYVVVGLSWVNRVFDEYVVNLGIDEGCRRLRSGGKLVSRVQNGRVQNYLRILGVSMAVLLLLLMWGCQRS